MRARRGHVLSMLVLAVLVAASGCGDSNDREETSTAAPAAGPTGTSAPADGAESKSSPSAPKSTAPPEASDFDRSKIRLQYTYKTIFSKSEVAFFVASGAAGSHIDQAKACVASLLAKAASAYCYAFPSERAFRASRVSRRPPVRMRRECWSAYWGKPSGRRPIGTASNPAAPTQGCPG